MSSIDEKRVYDEKTGRTDAYVATAAGVARVSVSGDIVGEFSLVHRCTARDIAAGGAHLAVATAEDVLVGPPDDLGRTGFESATAVGFRDGPVAAGRGRVARHRGTGAGTRAGVGTGTGTEKRDGNGNGNRDDGEWEELGRVADVRAIDGDLLAAADGVHRLDGTHVGLSNANDVATAGAPLAATGDGLYRLGNGWMEVLDGDFRAVASDGERAHAATLDVLYGRRDGEWDVVDTPVDDPVVGVAYGEAVYAVTADGTFLVDAGNGWRARSLGLSGACAIALPSVS